MAATATFDAGTTAVQIATSGEQDPRSITLINRGTGTVWFGFTQAAAEARTGTGQSKGVQLGVGDRLEADLLPNEQLWVSCASGTQRVEAIQSDARTYVL